MVFIRLCVYIYIYIITLIFSYIIAIQQLVNTLIMKSMILMLTKCACLVANVVDQ